MKFNKLSIFWAVILIAVVVCAGHLVISGGVDFLASAKFGIAAGFGALILDIIRTVVEWHSDTTHDK